MVGLFLRARNRDRVLVTNEEKKGGERWHCDDRPEPSSPQTTGWNDVLFRGFFRLLPEDLPPRVHKGNSRPPIQCALAAIEIALPILLPLSRAKFAEHVPYCGLQPYCFVMVHSCHPTSSAGGRKIVSVLSYASRPPSNPHLGFLIEGPELILGAVYQHPQAFAIAPQVPAHAVFLLFFQKYGAKKLAVPS